MADKTDQKLIQEIATKARRMAIVKNKLYPEQATLIEDLTKAHARIGLDLPKMLNCGASTLAHDVCGIYRNIDHDTGDLRDGVLPKCAK